MHFRNGRDSGMKGGGLECGFCEARSKFDLVGCRCGQLG